MKDFCRYDEFAGPLCGYGLGLLKSAPDTGHTECNRTWAECVDRGNQGRYGAAISCLSASDSGRSNGEFLVSRGGHFYIDWVLNLKDVIA